MNSVFLKLNLIHQKALFILLPPPTPHFFLLVVLQQAVKTETLDAI